MSEKLMYSNQLAELLHKMRNEVDGIYNTVLCSVDGLIIAEALPSTGDRTIEFYLANCLSLAQQIGKLLQIGDFDSIHLQGDADFLSCQSTNMHFYGWDVQAIAMFCMRIFEITLNKSS